MFVLGCLALAIITKYPLQTKLNYTKGLDKDPSVFSFNFGIMRIIIADGHVFSPPAEISKITHNKLTQFIEQ